MRLLATAVQARVAFASTGQQRALELPLAWAYGACVLGGVALFLGSELGVDLLGLEFDQPTLRARYRQGAMALGSALLACGGLAGLAGHWADRARAGRSPSEVDARRVRQMSAGGLSVALACVAAMLFGYVAAARNQTLDASYFKTSSPGDAVRALVDGMGSSVRVATFFPPGNPVQEEVRVYMEALARTGGITLEEYDRFADPVTAAEFQVRTDGVVVFRSSQGTERVLLPTDLDAARARLRVLDGAVQQALLKLTRERRVAYFTMGHGELGQALTEPLGGGAGTGGTDGGRGDVAAFRQLLDLLNYEVRDIGLTRGLGERVPEDGAILIALAPRTPFHGSEMGAIMEFLDRGGSLLLALEPDTDFELGPLEGRLGLTPGAMALDDERHLRETGGPADRRLIVTNRITPHPSVSTASRQGPGAGLLVVGPVSLTPHEGSGGVSARVTVQSLPSAFVDENGNYQFDAGEESKGEVGVVAAVEEGEDGMRALVFGDAEMFTDRVLARLALNAALAADGVRWLGREEALSGEVVSEEDVPITHTRQEDVAWFYGIIFGGPALVLLGGSGTALPQQARPPRGLGARRSRKGDLGRVSALRLNVGLAVLALLVAVPTWLRDSPSGIDLDRVLIWEEDSTRVTGVVWEAAEGRVEIQRRIDPEGRPFYWGIDSHEDADAEYPVGTAGRSLVDGLTRLRALRDLGDEGAPPGASPSGAGRLELVLGDRSRVLLLGDTTYGGEGRYAREEGVERLLVLPTSLFEPLEIGSDALRERQVHRFLPGDVVRARIVAGGVSIEADKVDGAWRRAGEEGVDAVLAGVLERADQLAIAGFRPLGHPLVGPPASYRVPGRGRR